MVVNVTASSSTIVTSGSWAATFPSLHLNDLPAVADRGVSGPWGPQFCGALCNGETQRLPDGGAGSPQVGSEAKPRRQTHFGNNILKIG